MDDEGFIAHNDPLHYPQILAPYCGKYIVFEDLVHCRSTWTCVLDIQDASS